MIKAQGERIVKKENSERAEHEKVIRWVFAAMSATARGFVDPGRSYNW